MRTHGHVVVDRPGEFRVHTSAYFRQEYYEAELDEIFDRAWIYVAHESELREPHTYKTAWIGKRPVIVVRGGDSRVRAFLNVCPHRGATICRDSSGSGATLRCPYHAWSFDTYGKNVGMPQAERFPAAFIGTENDLIAVPRVESYAGLIFACFDSGVVPLPDFLDGAREHIDLWHERRAQGELVVADAHRYCYQGNWKFQVENAMDGYHPGVVHASAFNAFRRFDGSFPDAAYMAKARQAGCTRGFAGGHSTLEGGAALDSARIPEKDRQEYLESLINLYGKERAHRMLSARHILIFPNLVLMDYNIRVVQPVRFDYTEIESYPVVFQGAPVSVRENNLREMQQRLGAAGMVSIDDIEIFNGLQNAGGGEITSLRLSRGIEAEQVLPNGERLGQYSDETPQRAFWREWKSRLAKRWMEEVQE